MPMSRYQIRNEYSLSDPELYRTAEKDDPEALLEGVAMAGFVGVLRQLGDLAEFAAEIFHDLHEVVMVTAARGHGLMSRVQELEAEVPSIERALLFQTDHSSFFHNNGIEWHPNFREDANLVASGDLPSFIMNAYEGCRGPPQLFHLDKFDIGGAGACLKRYTDPAFLKVGSSLRDSVDGLPNNKARNVKKRGARLNNEDSAESLSRSNPKLHDLFLEEPMVKTVNKPARVKLKRRLNGFPFDIKSGKSYMENLFATPPEHEMFDGVTRSSPNYGHHNSGSKLLEVRSVSPARNSIDRIRRRPHPDEAGATQNQLDEESNETDIHVDGIHMPPVVACELGDRSDAMELEVKTDSDLRMKNDWISTFLERQSLTSASNYEHFNSQQSHSHATTESEEGSTAASSSIISPYMQRTPVERSLTETKDEASLGIVDKGCSVDQVRKPSVFDNEYLIDKKRKNAELPNAVLRSPDPLYTLPHCGSEEDSVRAQGCVSDEAASALLYKEKESGAILGSPPPRTRSFVTPLQAGSSDFSTREYIWNQPDSINLPSTSLFSEDTSASITSDLLRKDNYDLEVLKPMRSSISSSSISGITHQNITESKEIIHPSDTGGVIGVDIQECSLTMPCKYTDRAYDGNEVEVEGFNFVSDSPNHSPCTMETAFGRDHMESYSGHRDQCSNSSHDEPIDSEKSFLSVSETFPNAPDTYDAQETHELPRGDKSWSNGERDDILNTDSEVIDKPCSSSRNSTDSKGRSVISENHEIRATDVHLSDVLDSETSKKMSSSVPENSGYTMIENIALSVGPSELAENFIPSFADSGFDDGDNHPNMKHVDSVFDVSEESNTSCGQQADASFAEAMNENTAAGILSSEINFRELESEESVTQERSRLPPHQLEGRLHVSSETHSPRKQGSLGNDVSGYPNDSSNFTFSLPKENQVVFTESPPLPPLPPFKWRMGNLQHCPTAMTNLASSHEPISIGGSSPVPSGDSRSVFEGMNCFNPSAPDASPKEGAKPRSSVPETRLIHSKAHIPPEIEKEQQLSNMDCEDVVNQKKLLPPETSLPDASSAARCLLEDINPSPTVNISNISSKEEAIKQSSAEASLIPSNDPISDRESKVQEHLSLPVMNAVGREESVSASVTEAVHARSFIESSSSHPVSDLRFKEENAEPSSSVEADPGYIIEVQTSSAAGMESLNNKESHSLDISLPAGSTTQFSPGTTTKEEKPEQSSSAMDADLIHPHSETESKKKKLFTPISDGGNATSVEEGVANELPKAKPAMPHNPLIDSISALDKSKLRKVVQNDRPQLQQVNERDSLLEQIRAKSFNLKPALGNRPRVEAPRTNLKVAAILEKKANAIRQALAGSDEDDEDSWSDS